MRGRATLFTAVTSFVAGLACAPLLYLASGPAAADEKKTPDAFLSGGKLILQHLAEFITGTLPGKFGNSEVTHWPHEDRGSRNTRRSMSFQNS